MYYLLVIDQQGSYFATDDALTPNEALHIIAEISREDETTTFCMLPAATNSPSSEHTCEVVPL